MSVPPMRTNPWTAPGLVIDHVGYVGSDLNVLAATFARLGFTVAPAGELAAYVTADNDPPQVVPLGQASRHVLLEHGYIELTQVQASDGDHHLGERGRSDGLHILAMGASDAAQAADRLTGDGVAIGATHESAREVEYPDRRGLARFSWFPLDPLAAAEAYTCVVQHRTPELVLPPIGRHPNGASRLEEVVLAVSDLDEACPRWMDIVVASAVEEEERAWVARPANGPALRLVDDEWIEDVFPGAELPPAPAAVAIRVASSLWSTDEILDVIEIEPAGVTDRAVWFRPEHAGGAVLEIVAVGLERPV